MKKTVITFFTILLIISSLSAELKFDVPSVNRVTACTPVNTERSEKHWCYSDLEYTIALHYRNDSTEDFSNVGIHTEFPSFFMEYVPNSTEYGINIQSGGGILTAEEWVSIPDLENNAFPLENGVFNIELIKSSREDDCFANDENSFLVRYKVKISELTPRNHAFEIKVLLTKEGEGYSWLNYYPLRITFYDNCLEDQEDIDMSQCGGSTEDAETPDEYTDFDNDDLTNDIDKKDDGCAITLI